MPINTLNIKTKTQTTYITSKDYIIDKYELTEQDVVILNNFLPQISNSYLPEDLLIANYKDKLPQHILNAAITYRRLVQLTHLHKYDANWERSLSRIFNKHELDFSQCRQVRNHLEDFVDYLSTEAELSMRFSQALDISVMEALFDAKRLFLELPHRLRINEYSDIKTLDALRTSPLELDELRVRQHFHQVIVSFVKPQESKTVIMEKFQLVQEIFHVVRDYLESNQVSVGNLKKGVDLVKNNPGGQGDFAKLLRDQLDIYEDILEQFSEESLRRFWYSFGF